MLLDDRNEAAKYDLELVLSLRDAEFAALSSRGGCRRRTGRMPAAAIRGRTRSTHGRGAGSDRAASSEGERLLMSIEFATPLAALAGLVGTGADRDRDRAQPAGKRSAPRARPARARGSGAVRAAARPGLRVRAARPRGGAAVARAAAGAAGSHRRPAAGRARQLPLDARRPPAPAASRVTGARPRSRASCALRSRSCQPASRR